MSSNITITDEQIAEIANRMADEGQKVSPLAIWSEVHTGSVVAVAAALRKWREARTPRAQQVAERPALPESVTEPMREALDRLWNSAQDEAERAVARRLAAMRQRVEDASNERDDALAELQSTVQELDAMQVHVDKMSAAFEAKADSITGLEEDIANAVQRTDAAEKRAQELTERVANLEAELERAEADLATQREAAAQAASVLEAAPVDNSAEQEAERVALEAQHSEAVSRLEGELEAIRVALQAEQEAHAAQREEVAGAQAARDAAALELQNAQAARDTATQELQDAQAARDTAALELQDAQAARDAAALELQSAQAQVANLTDERTADASEIARLSASLTEAQQRAEELAEQHAAASAAAETEAEAAPAPAVADIDAAAEAQKEIEALKAQLARETESHAAAIAEARETVKKWSEYANGLKQQLVQANEKSIVALARGAGEASLSRRLATELGSVVPEHELLRKDTQQRVILDTITSQLEQQGFSYDAKTGAVTKLSVVSENTAA